MGAIPSKREKRKTYPERKDTQMHMLMCFSMDIKAATEELMNLVERRTWQQEAYIPKLGARIDATERQRQQYEQNIETIRTELENIRATITRLRTRKTPESFGKAIQESGTRLQHLTTGIEQLRAQLRTWTAGREPGQLSKGISVQVKETQKKIREMETEMAGVRKLLSTQTGIPQEIYQAETRERLQATKYRALNDFVPRLLEALQQARETIASESKSLENSKALLLWLRELLVDAKKLQEPKYEEDIRNKIRRVFVEHIKPDNVLQYFHAINKKVLTQNHIERVQATTNCKGRSSGAAELIALLPYYQGWFKCLLAVLRLPEVNLGHVAQMMEEAVADSKQDEQHGVTKKIGEETEKEREQDAEFRKLSEFEAPENPEQEEALKEP